MISRPFTYSTFVQLVLLCFAFISVRTQEQCSGSSDCDGKSCCDGICQSKERCSHPKHSECTKSDDCRDGSSCVRFRCKESSKRSRRSCSFDDDCLYNGSKMKCCSSVCRKTCFTSVPRESCKTSRDCRVGQVCETGKCIKKGPKSRSDTATTRAGFLSAAIITGAIFVVIMCCCFLKESKNSQGRNGRGRRHGYRARRGSAPTSSGAFTLSRSHAISVNSGTNTFSYPGHLHPNSDLENQLEPPPYHTLSFSDQPPSYDEAVGDGGTVRHQDLS